MVNISARQSRSIIKSPEKLFILFLVFLSVLVRLINLDSPLLTGNIFRQTMTAMTVWTFIHEGISVLGYQTPVFGPPWTIPMEFPIYQLTAAFIVKLGIENIDLAGRIAAILYFYLSACFLYLTCKNYLGKIASTCVLLFYLWSPFTILWSRNFMIDYASVAFSMGFFYYFTRWLNSQRVIPFLLSIAFGVLAFLVKVTTLPIVLIPMGYLALKKVSAILKEKKDQLGQYIKDNIIFIACLTAIFLIPFVPFFLWLQYSDAVKASSEFTRPLTSTSLSEWNFGTWTQKTSIRNWAKIIRLIVKYVVTFPVLVLMIFGPALYFRSSRKGGDFVVIFALGAFLTVFTFFNLYWVHDYYLMAVSPSISIAAGFCCYLVLTKVLNDDFRLKRWFYMPILIIVISLFSTGNYLSWSMEASYDDPMDPTLNLAKAIRDNTTEKDYVIVADVFNWTPQYLYYAKRKGFMLWYFEGDESNRFFKAHNFTTVVHAGPHEKLFSNWKYKKLLAVYDKFKVVRVSDNPIN